MREKPSIQLRRSSKLSIQELVRPAPVSYIVPNLFLGDKNAAADRNELQKLKVTHIVNCAKDLPDCFSPASSTSSSSTSSSTSTSTPSSPSKRSPRSQSSSFSSSSSPTSSTEMSDEEMCEADDDHSIDACPHNPPLERDDDDDDGPNNHDDGQKNYDSEEHSDGGWRPVAYHRCELVDSSRSEAAFEESLESVFAFLDAAMAVGSGNVVLIHCCAGRSRAPAVMTAYLMHRFRWSLAKAYTHVCQARPVVCPNRGFLQVLLRLEMRLLGTNTMHLRSNGRHHTLVALESRPRKLAVY